MNANDFKGRVATIPLRDVQAVPAHECTGRSMALIREHLMKHFKVDAENAHLDTQINEDIWAHGRQSPPNKFYIHAARFDEDDESVVKAEPTK